MIHVTNVYPLLISSVNTWSEYGDLRKRCSSLNIFEFPSGVQDHLSCICWCLRRAAGAAAHTSPVPKSAQCMAEAISQPTTGSFSTKLRVAQNL